jgi:hypothetical protein
MVDEVPYYNISSLSKDIKNDTSTIPVMFGDSPSSIMIPSKGLYRLNDQFLSPMEMAVESLLIPIRSTATANKGDVPAVVAAQASGNLWRRWR